MVDKSLPASDKIELADDRLLDNEEFKKSIAIPYFKDVYKDLASRGVSSGKDDKKKGVDQTAFLGVSFLMVFTRLVYKHPWYNWGAALFCL